MVTRIRTRFAPSPTGFLHIGGVRTALFSYLFAKGRGGEFVLRIEDTDTERSEAHYTDDILKSLQWLGLQWDEGPIFQSQRFDRYREVCHELIRRGAAYYCYCTSEELEVERKTLEASGRKPMYGGKCRDLGHREADPQRGSAVIRFKVPRTGEVGYSDQIRGPIHFQCAEIEDFVILRSNGSPTYNLSCVVDDHDGQISHVIRGDDHINNTPKQILIFQALEWIVPGFAHLPMILGPDKKKLSKRHGAVSANQYRADGYLPHAVVNYLARLGWSHGDQEIFSKEELLKYFGLEKIGKSSAVFNVEKLLWLNGHYMKEARDEELAKILLEDSQGLSEKLLCPEGLQMIALSKVKVKTIKELALMLSSLLSDSLTLTLDEIVATKWSLAVLAAPFDHIVREISHLRKGGHGTISTSGVDAKVLETLYRGTADRFGLKLVELAQPTRFLLSGATVGPSLFDVMVCLSWNVVIGRLSRYKEVFK